MMNKLGLVLLATLVSTNTMANEVGATHSQSAEFVPEAWTVAIAENGTTDEWGLGPVNVSATPSQVKSLNRMVDRLNTQINADLDIRIEKQFETLID